LPCCFGRRIIDFVFGLYFPPKTRSGIPNENISRPSFSVSSLGGEKLEID